MTSGLLCGFAEHSIQKCDLDRTAGPAYRRSMKIGIPTEIKNNEYRVGITPAGAHELVRRGHQVLVQAGAGVGSGFTDEAYRVAGAVTLATADEVWADSDMVVKVKEPIEPEYGRLRGDQVLFTYLHLAASEPCTRALLDAGTTAIAYETVQLPDRSLPLLAPMSEVAGRLSIQAGGYHLMRAAGGAGVLMGGVPGTPKANVLVIGGGVAGEHAAANALGMDADVTVLDVSLPALRRLEMRFGGAVATRFSTTYEIAEQVESADLVIGSVLVPGAAAPKLVTDAMVKAMRPGSVLVDVAIDQGGCFETSRPTTHAEPTYVEEGCVHYCVTNMPGAVARTSAVALNNATLPFVVALAEKGWRRALYEDPHFLAGLNVHEGSVTYEAVAHDLDLPFRRPQDALGV
jgi:alanine dehydrogenase